MARFTYDHRAALVSEGYTEVPAPQANATFYVGRTRQGEPAAACFLGKQSKPYWNLRFLNTERLEAKVRETLEACARVVAVKAEREAERKAQGNPWREGDIAYTSWGYNQTQIGCFQCVGVRGMVAVFRPLCTDRVAAGQDAEWVTPRKGDFAGPAIRVLAKGGGKINGHGLSRWTGGRLMATSGH